MNIILPIVHLIISFLYLEVAMVPVFIRNIFDKMIKTAYIPLQVRGDMHHLLHWNMNQQDMTCTLRSSWILS
jgi:hypothetical protein